MTDAQVLESILERARSVPVGDLPEFIGRLAMAQATATARLATPSPAPRQAYELLGVAEAARRLGISKAYLYRHHGYPFERRMGRKLLYSSAGIDAYIKNQNGGR